MSGISEEFFNYPEAQSKDGNMGWMCEKCHKVIKITRPRCPCWLAGSRSWRKGIGYGQQDI